MTANGVEILRILAELGSTVFVVVVGMAIAYRLALRFGVPFIDSQQKIADAMGRQAECLTNLQSTVHEYIGRDNNDHREILLSTQVVIQEMQTLADEIRKMDRQTERP